MTPEEAYRHLQLHQGTDMQTVRKRFAAMHNDYRMRIDNAPTPALRDSFEKELEVLKQAYNLILENGENGSESYKGSVSGGRSYIRPSFGVPADVKEALAWFGLTEHQPVHSIIFGMQQRIASLAGEHLLQALKRKDTIDGWLNPGGSVTDNNMANAQVKPPAKLSQAAPKGKTNPAVYIISGIILIIAVVAILLMKPSREVSPRDLLNKFDRAGKFHEGLAKVRKNNAYGFVNTKGELVIPVKYSKADDFSEGLALVSSGDTQGFIDTTGTMAFVLEYEEADSFSEGLAKVKSGGKYGYINRRGEIIIPCMYTTAGSFSEGLAMVRYHGKYGFINNRNAMVIPCEYDNVRQSFKEGVVRVKKGTQWFYINKSNQRVNK